MRAHSAIGAAEKDRGLREALNNSLAGSELQRQSSDAVARFRPIVPQQTRRSARRLAFRAATAWTSVYANAQTTLRGTTYYPFTFFVFNF